MKRRDWLFLALLSSSPIRAARPRYGGTLRVFPTLPPVNLEPFSALVTAVQPDTGKRVWRFTMRPNVTLHGGILWTAALAVERIKAAFPSLGVSAVGNSVLVGGDTAQPGNGNQDRMGASNNLLAIVIDPQRLGDPNGALVEARTMLNYFRSARPIDPAQPVLLPGEIEARTRTQRLAEGIRLDAATWKQLTRLAQDAGITPPRTESAAA